MVRAPPFFWIIMAVIAIFAIAPVFGDNVELRESLILAALYITLASNLNLMLGYTGYINFGSIVFFGLGGYICVWLVSAHAWPLAASLPAAGVCVSFWRCSSGSASCGCAARSSRSRRSASTKAVQAFVENFEPWGGSSGIYLVDRRSSSRSAGRRRRFGSSIS